MKCCICDKEIEVQKIGDTEWNQGHNAQPIKDGRCCTECNNTKVVPARIEKITARPVRKFDWTYKLQLHKLHDKFSEDKITFMEYCKEIAKAVAELIKKVKDEKNISRLDTNGDLEDELQNWLDDFAGENDGEYETYLDEGDMEELEGRMNDLYDIGDYNKRIWMGI